MSPSRSFLVRHSRISRGEAIDGLILDGHFRQALAVIRSLGRGGSLLGSLVCASEEKSALTFESRWCSLAAVVPDISSPGDDYVDAVLDLLGQYRVRFVVPCSDGSIEALRTKRDEVERRTRLALASEPALSIAVDKGRTLSLASDLGIAVPRTVALRDAADIPAALGEVGLPAVMKPVRSWVRDGAGGTGMRLSCTAVQSVSDGERILEAVHAAGGSVVIQEWLSGRRDAVSVFYGRGRVWASFAQTSYRELPPLGGASILFESIPPLADIVEPAERLVRAMELECCSMVEFRRDHAGRPRLMEVNPRLPGSVALAVAAGVDFPNLLQAWALERDLWEVSSYRVGVRRQWMTGNLEYLIEVIKRGGAADMPSRAKNLAAFFGDFARRPSAFDVFSASDIRPILMELQTVAPRLRHVLTVLARRLRK